jgi:hypothetical protein
MINQLIPAVATTKIICHSSTLLYAVVTGVLGSLASSISTYDDIPRLYSLNKLKNAWSFANLVHRLILFLIYKNNSSLPLNRIALLVSLLSSRIGNHAYCMSSNGQIQGRKDG